MTRLTVGAILVYQKTISPDHGIMRNQLGTLRCRFYPSCSSYALDAMRQYGLVRGGVLSIKRILRCHPFSEGGYDPIPMQKSKLKMQNEKE